MTVETQGIEPPARLIGLAWLPGLARLPGLAGCAGCAGLMRRAGPTAFCGFLKYRGRSIGHCLDISLTMKGNSK
ncbi:hypothetical protein VW23_015705 [Devosia insulae DS-56]|uniref:Uncharacterized protein n=1 Tax=Devosia insulae DS-56 TaxID=1116389 RepID=A0A1E5XSH7_9HYPH|nr:hypothetical protein VW23_015705 [Devosia insulae DS-56]